MRTLVAFLLGLIIGAITILFLPDPRRDELNVEVRAQTDALQAAPLPSGCVRSTARFAPFLVPEPGAVGSLAIRRRPPALFPQFPIGAEPVDKTTWFLDIDHTGTVQRERF
jgi:hypothetical protein